MVGVHRPGLVWNDTDGNRIQAHGAGIMHENGTYYMYGECRDFAPGVNEVSGVSCYTSTNLLDWRFEGLALPALHSPGHDLDIGMVLERPKVVKCPSTGRYVMWMHIDSPDYSYARAGVAVANDPRGPFEYLGSTRPNGQMSRDMTLFADDDGKAYHIYSSEDNATLYVSLLTDDYLAPSGTYTRNFERKWREAPAMFKYNGLYYLITSGCTGWKPNEAMYAVADSPLGPWREMGNPCKGAGSETTFDSQSTHVLPMASRPGTFVFMADRWNKDDLPDSRYVWLPMRVEGETVEMGWVDEWTLEA